MVWLKSNNYRKPKCQKSLCKSRESERNKKAIGNPAIFNNWFYPNQEPHRADDPTVPNNSRGGQWTTCEDGAWCYTIKRGKHENEGSLGPMQMWKKENKANGKRENFENSHIDLGIFQNKKWQWWIVSKNITNIVKKELTMPLSNSTHEQCFPEKINHRINIRERSQTGDKNCTRN